MIFREISPSPFLTPIQIGLDEPGAAAVIAADGIPGPSRASAASPVKEDSKAEKGTEIFLETRAKYLRPLYASPFTLPSPFL